MVYSELTLPECALLIIVQMLTPALSEMEINYAILETLASEPLMMEDKITNRFYSGAQAVYDLALEKCQDIDQDRDRQERYVRRVPESLFNPPGDDDDARRADVYLIKFMDVFTQGEIKALVIGCYQCNRAYSVLHFQMTGAEYPDAPVVDFGVIAAKLDVPGPENEAELRIKWKEAMAKLRNKSADTDPIRPGEAGDPFYMMWE